MAERKRKSDTKPDPRQLHTFLAEDVPAGDLLRFPAEAGALVASVMPVRMRDGQVILFPAPRFVAFDLIEAKRHLDRGIRLRKRALTRLRTTIDGSVTITDKQAILDCFAEFVEAVLLSYAAVEALVNEMIESLDESVTINRVNASGIDVELGKAEMVRRMSTGEKIDSAGATRDR